MSNAFKNITTDNLTLTNRLTINNMPTAAPNQFLQTNGSGTPIWGAGSGSGQPPGLNEQSLWTISGTTSWQSRSFRYGITYFEFTNGQDWNTNPQLNPIGFGSVSSQNQSYGTSAFTAISVQTAGTVLRCNTSGVYMFHVLAPLTNTNLVSSAKIRFNVVVGGFITLNPGIPCTILPNTENVLSASFPIGLSAGQTIQFSATREGGTGTAIIDGLNSRMCIQFLNTLN